MRGASRAAGVWALLLLASTVGLAVGLATPGLGHGASAGSAASSARGSIGPEALPRSLGAESTSVPSTDVDVGHSPAGLAYDPALGEVFVANTGSDNVSVVNDTTDAVVASVDVGGAPGCLAYDPGASEVFAVNTATDNVSVISTESNRVVATVAVGRNASGCTYDTGTHQLFVVNSGVPPAWAGSVSVISDATDLVVATVAVGAWPQSAVYDAGTSQVFVVNFLSETVSVLSDATDQVVATIADPGNLWSIAYDSAQGEVAVEAGNGIGGWVSIISDANDRYVTNISVPATPTAIAYDARGGLLLVLSAYDDTVRLISGATDQVVGTLNLRPMYQNPSSVVYDTQRAEVWVSISDTASVTILPVPGPSAQLTASPSTVAIGQTSTLTVSVTLGVPPVSWTLTENGSSANITGVSGGTVSFVPRFAGVYTFYLNSTDADGNTSDTVATVTVPVILATLTATPTTVDVGAESNLTVFVLGGTPPVTWTLTLNGSNSNLSGVSDGTYAFAPSYPGNYTFYLNATDGQGHSSDAVATVAVPPLSATLTASPTTVPVGGSTMLVLSVAGGVRPITWTLSESGSVANLSGVSDGRYVFVPASAGSFTFYLNATDADAATSNATATVVVPSSYGRAVSVGPAPYGLAYASNRGEIFVGNECGGGGSGNISVINDSTDTVVATINDSGVACGTAAPWNMAYDSGTDEVYVANFAANSVTVISAVTNTVVTTIPVGAWPQSIAYDGGTHQLFVTDTDDNDVSVISDVSNSVVATVAVGDVPQDVVYDPVTDEVYVFNDLPKGQTANTVSVISDATDKVVATIPSPGFDIAAVYDSGTGQVFFAGARENGTDNNVGIITDGSDQVGTTVPVGSFPDGIDYDAAAGEVFTANANSNNVTVIDDGTDQVVANLSTGGYPTAVAYDPGTSQLFVANGNDNNVSILSISHPPGANVTFTESGLPARGLATHGWTVSLDGARRHSTTSTITFTAPNGTDPLLVTGLAGFASHTSGTLDVSGPASVPVTFVKQKTVSVAFVQSGLPKGQLWCLELDAAKKCTTQSSVAYENLSVGSYTYALRSPSSGQDVTARIGTTTVPTAGNLSLSRGATVRYTFVYPYVATFSETGLANGTWSVTIKGETHRNATGEPIAFDLPNGTYRYTLGSGAGFRSSGSPPKLKVDGGAANVTVAFTPKRADSRAPAALRAIAPPSAAALLPGACAMGAAPLARRKRPCWDSNPGLRLRRPLG